MKKKILSMVLTLLIAVTMMPSAAFADEVKENSTWIPVAYSGDVSVTVKNDISHNNDANRGFLEVYEEGKISFEVEGKNGLALQTLTIMSGACDASLDNALDLVTFSDNEGTFKADENGKVAVTLNVKTGRAYYIQGIFDFNDENTENSVWIPITYSGDVSVNIKFNGNYDSDTDRCIAEFYEEGKTSLDVANKWNDATLKAVVLYSGLLTESLDSVSYDSCDGIFHTDSKEHAKITLNLKNDRAYTIRAIYEGSQDCEEIQKDISKVSAAVATSKTSKGIKVKLSTKNGSISNIKDFGYKVEYKIYRATSKNGKYTLKKTTTAKTYTDKSVKKGKKYYYKVRMYVKDSNGKVIKSTKLSQSNVSSKLYK